MGCLASERRHIGFVGGDGFVGSIETQQARSWHCEWVGGVTLGCQFFAVWGVVNRFGEYLSHSTCGVMK